jgi:hypothetical protein
MKKILSMFVTFGLVFVMALLTGIMAQASYTPDVKITVPNNENANDTDSTTINVPQNNDANANAGSGISDDIAVGHGNDNVNTTNDVSQNNDSRPNSNGRTFDNFIIRPSDWNNPFSDVGRSDWFYDNVALVQINGLMTGTSPTTFAPNMPLTRAMFVRILANLEKVDLSQYTTSRFSDVPVAQWYTSAVEWAADMGIVTGIGNNMFAPNANVTREQMAVMLYNYINFKGITLPANNASAPFADESEISSWAIEAVKAIQAAGIISGRPGNLFDPQATATRVEVATIFARFIEIMSNIDTVDVNVNAANDDSALATEDDDILSMGMAFGFTGVALAGIAVEIGRKKKRNRTV